MRAAVLLLAVAVGSWTAVAETAAPARISGDVQQAGRTELHENAVRLVGLMDLRQHLLESRLGMAEQGRQEIIRRFPNYAPEFAEEWAKRMAAELPVDEYVKVVVAAYEKNFENEDLLELIRVQEDLHAGEAPVISGRLKEKMTVVNVEIESEINGGFAQLGAKLGGQIGVEIAKEHPEWLKRPE